MPKVTRHAPGAPCWFGLSTTDQGGAKKFYSSLFGWSVAGYPMGPGEVYSMFQLHGVDVGAAATLRKDLRERGVPSHWAVYFATADVDASAALAAELGGTILAPAFDVMGQGRM